MAHQDDKDPVAQSKYPGKDSLFVQRRRLDEVEQMKLIKEILDINKKFRSQCKKWETASDAFSRKVEISIAHIQARIQQAEEKGTDSTSVATEKTLESDDSLIPDIDDEKAAVKGCYKMWCDDLKKTIKEQRQKTRKCAEKWFRYLHRFDCMEEQVTPPHFLLSWSESFCHLGVIVLCIIWSTLSFSPEVTEKCKIDFFPCVYEKALGVLFGLYCTCIYLYNETFGDTGNV